MRTIGLATVGLALVTIVLGSADTAYATKKVEALPPIELAMGDEGGCNICTETETCFTDNHRTNISGGALVANKTVGGTGSHFGPHNCFAGDCGTHKECEQEPCDPMCGEAALEAGVDQENVEDLARAIAASNRIVINEERSALQRLDCRGQVVTHIQLQPELMSSVVAEWTALKQNMASPAPALREG